MICGPYADGFVSQLMALSSPQKRSISYKPALAWFATLGGFWVFVLVTMGAFTTSIGAGMVFLDWPLSNGSLNPEGWLSNLAMFAEHSHRLSAGVMTIITIVLAAWLWRTEERRWLRRLAIAAVVLVFLQAFVGGLRVLLEKHQIEMINTSVGRLFAMAHACLAQIFVCTLAAIAAACSRPWIEQREPSGPPTPQHIRRLGVLCCALLLVQLAIAAVMRHSYAGLAIPTFPHSNPDGGWLPATWNFRVAINFTHRVMAMVLGLAIICYATLLLRQPVLSRALKTGAGSVVVLLALQIYLGASVIWSGRSPELTTAHVIVGASLLATTFLITWVLHRDVVEKIATSPTHSIASTHIPQLSQA
jgi:cytochrome c oxidase assembly protein subunit 15